ncbi:hypothetical protein [Desertimonas flava]|uniref:hypothetical protein n=1 Tax=Desertimonas flava TaxID=2064846 RepID=UPI0013C4D5D8|nr:hypothetical protein [Desertimonas flava]
MGSPQSASDADLADANLRMAAITARREAATLRNALATERRRTRDLGAALADTASERDDAVRQLHESQRLLDELRCELDATLRRRSVRAASAIARLLRPPRANHK